LSIHLQVIDPQYCSILSIHSYPSVPRDEFQKVLYLENQALTTQSNTSSYITSRYERLREYQIRYCSKRILTTECLKKLIFKSLNRH